MIELTSTEAIWEAIYKLQVRGAPAIGVAAAYGIYQAVRHLNLQDSQAFALSLQRQKTIWRPRDQLLSTCFGPWIACPHV